MKYLKMIGLAAVAAMALMAIGAATASAASLYSGTTTLGKGTVLSATLKAGTSSKLTTTSGTTLNTCTVSTVGGTITNPGGSGVAVEGEVKKEELSWEKCVSGAVHTLAGGTLSVSYTSGLNGSMTASNFEVTVETIFGPCTYVAGAGTALGTLTGSTTGSAT